MLKKKTTIWFLVFIFFAGVYYFNPEIFKEIIKLKNITFVNFILISLLCIFNQFLLGIEIKILCQTFGVQIGMIESFGLSSIRSIANYLPMSAGVISNAIYLKTQKRLTIANYSSSLTVSMVLMLLIAGSIGCLTSLYLKIFSNAVDLNLILLFFCVFIGSCVVMVVKFPVFKSKNFVSRFIRDFQQGYAVLKRDRRTIQKLITLKLVVLFLLIIKMKLLFISVGYNLNFGTIVLIVMSSVAFRIVTILPGNIGLTETISGFTAAASGSTFEYGFVGVAIDRIIQMIWIFLLGGFFMFYFSNKLTNNH